MEQERIWTAALVVIGDEILSGRTQDKNVAQLASWLNVQGIRLAEVRVVADKTAAIVEAVNTLRARNDYLFTTGGIGPTHDDITADAVADAYGAPLHIHPEARRVMEERYARMGSAMTDARLRMARIPQGAVLIENAESAAPGFSIGGAHVMAGVPAVFRAMVDALVPRLVPGRPPVSRTLRVQRPESDVAEGLRSVAADFADLSLGSYPFRDEGGFGTNLVIRGLDAARVDAAEAALRGRLAL